MFCTKCGNEIKEGSNFCTKCGNPIRLNTEKSVEQSKTVEQPKPMMQTKPVEQSKPMAQTMSVEQPKPVENPKKTSGKARIIVGVCAIVALLIAIGAFGVMIVRNQNGRNLMGSSDVRNEEASEEIEVKSDIESENSEITMMEETENSLADMTEEVDTQATEVADGNPLDEEYIELLSTDTKEGALQQDIVSMNSADYKDALIDVYAKNYLPAERDDAAIWNNDVFYTVEGYDSNNKYTDKNICNLQKRQLKNATTGNIIQYEIYINPLSGIANKIVSIEYLADSLEVFEYYYDNDGKVNFIFQYVTDNYVSTSATPDKYGCRYLFNEDCMVTWRQIDESGTINYILGENEAKRMKNQFGKKTMKYYKDLDDAQKQEFDEREVNMLNAAYNTYNTVLNSMGIATIQGYVYNGNGSPAVDYKVELYSTDFQSVLFYVKTDANGFYSISVPNEVYTYNLRISFDNMTNCDIYLVEISNEQLGVYQDSVYMFVNDETLSNVELVLGDAFEYSPDGTGMVMLKKAEVTVRKGINNWYGEAVANATSDDSGYVTMALESGIYTAQIDADGYETMYYTIVSNPYAEKNKYEFYAAQTLEEGEYAIVLTWGEYPYDIDSHLFTTTSSNDSTHIWYGNMSDTNSSYLDVDDTSSYGPETVTIRSFKAENYYKYCVVDFSNCASGKYTSYEMSNSKACANVYSSEGLVATFYVPTNKKGVIWEVFEIRNGVISPIQRYYSGVEDKSWWHSDK